MSAAPEAVTIGLPVYNGARFLDEALDALRAQTYPALRILASDNASTDETPAILARHAAADPRITVVRQTTNIGGAGNFSYTLEAAETSLFLWAAHDDILAPTFVERCVETLAAYPDALLCTTDIVRIDEAGHRIDMLFNLDSRGLDLNGRVEELMHRGGWYAMYGVFRRERFPLPLIVRYGGDVTKTAQLLTHGHVVKVPEPLLLYRIHAEAYTADESQAKIDHTLAAPARPYTTMLCDIAGAFHEGAVRLGEDPERIRRTLVRTVAFEHPFLLGVLARENGVSLDQTPAELMRALRAAIDAGAP